MSAKRIATAVYDFNRSSFVPTSGAACDFIKVITGAAPPTAAFTAGYLTLALTSASQTQNVCVYQADELPFLIAELVRVRWWAKTTAGLTANDKISMGLCSARNDDPDATTASAQFRLSGDNTVGVKTETAALDTGVIATGFSLSTTLKEFQIDFQGGLKTKSEAASVGGKSNVLFYMDNDRGDLRRVCPGTTFDMSGYSSGLQLFFQIQKTSTDVGTLYVRRVEVDYRIN